MKKNLLKDDIINTIKTEKKYRKENFGVLNIGLFGSYAKDQQAEESDIDFLVEFMEPRFDWIASLQRYMEAKFNRKIEIVRKRNLPNSRFLQRVEKDVIYA